MAFTIRLAGTGRTFEAQPNETVLDAALRSGVRLPYNCSNGTCGECKARIAEGTLSHVDFHDYPLSEADKMQNYTLLCSAYPAENLVIEVQEAKDSDDIPHQQLTARISRIEQLSDECLVLHLRTPRTRTLRFLAGQYVRLELPGGETAEKAVASCPCNGRQLQFHLHRSEGDLARRLFEASGNGDAVALEGPFGRFTLDEASDRPVVMVAAGTGFAPVKSIIEQAIAIELPAPVRLVRVAGSAAGLYLENYARSWVEALDDYAYLPLVVAEAADPEEVAEAVLSAVEIPLEQSDLYLAGGAELNNAVLARLRREGIPCDRVAVFPVGRDACF